MTHAFFKACLFLGAGSVIHAMGGEQDMRNDGRPASKTADHFLDFSCRDARDLRRPAVRRLHVEGRNHLERLLARSSAIVWLLLWVERRNDRVSICSARST